MDILSDETVLSLLDSDLENGEVAWEAWCEAFRRGIAPGQKGD